MGKKPTKVPININRGLWIGYTPEFLYLKIMPPLSIVMHDLQIPWSAVESTSHYRWFSRDMVRLNLSGGIFIDFRQSDISAAMEHVPKPSN